NYPFVYPAMKADNPKLFKVFKWAPYPSVYPGRPARVTIGGADLAVSSTTQHSQLAYQAILCLRNAENQLNAAIKGGLPPALPSLNNTQKRHPPPPSRPLTRAQLNNGPGRPNPPLYQVVPVQTPHVIPPPASIVPTTTEPSLRTGINNALQGKGLTP